MTGRLLDIVVVMVVHLLQANLRLLLALLPPFVPLTRVFRLLRTLRRDLFHLELLLLSHFAGPFLHFFDFLLRIVA